MHGELFDLKGTIKKQLFKICGTAFSLMKNDSLKIVYYSL